MGSLCGSSTNTTTTVNTPPPQVLANYQDLVNRAKDLGTQLQAGPQQAAAQLTQQQLGGINNVDLTTGMAAPYFGAGLSGMSSGFDTVGGALGYVPQGAATLQGALGYLPQGAAALQGALAYIPQGIVSLGKASDYYSQGAGMASAGAAPIHQMQFSKQAVDQYMSPYTANVIDTTLANIQHQNMVQQNELQRRAILGGNAFGGDRAGVAAAELGRGQAAVSDQTIATLWDKNYSQALNEFNVQQAVDLNTQQNNMARMLQAAGLYSQFGQGEGQLGTQYGQLAATQGNIGAQFGQLAQTQGQLANVYNNLATTQGNLGGLQANIGNQVAMLGPAATQTALNSANAQITAGTVAQQTYQNQINAEWNAYLLRLGIPSYNLLSGAVLGTGAGSGGTSQTQSPGPSPLSQIAGLGIAGLGLYNLSDEREKENIQQIGKMYDGQPLYRYNFKGSPRTEVGLLAQDVEQDNPEAVGEFGDGRKAVNYDTATRDAADRGHYASGGGIDLYGDDSNDDSGIGSRLEIAAANALAREFAENANANDAAARLIAGAGYASGGYTGNDPLSGAGGMGGYGSTGGYGNMGGYGTTGGNAGNYSSAYDAEENTNYPFVNPTVPGYAGPTPNDGGGYGAGASGYVWRTGTKSDIIPGETWQQYNASADPLWAGNAGITPLMNRPAPYGNSGSGGHEGTYTPPPPPAHPPTEGGHQPPPSGGGDPLPPDPDPYVPPAATPRPPLPPEHRNHPYYQASQVATQPGRYAEGGSTSGETDTMPNNRFADLRAMFANNANGSGLAQLQALRDRFANMGGEGGGGGGGFAGLQALRDQLANLGGQAWGGQHWGGQGGGGQGGGGQDWGSQAWRDRLTALGWTPPATTPTPDPTPDPTPTPTPAPASTNPYEPASTAMAGYIPNVYTPPAPTNTPQGDPAPGGRGGRGGGSDPAPGGGRGGRGSGGNTQAAPVYTFPGQTWQEYMAATDPIWGRAAGMTPDSPWYQPPAPQQIYDNGARGYPASTNPYEPASTAMAGYIPNAAPPTSGYYPTPGYDPAPVYNPQIYDNGAQGYPAPGYNTGSSSWYPTDAANYNNPEYAASIAPRQYASGGYVDDIPDPFLSNVSDQVSGIKNLAALRRAGMSAQGRGTSMPRMGIPSGSPNTSKQTNEGMQLADQLRKIGRPKDPNDRITFGKLFGTSSGDPLDLSPPVETGATGGRMGTNNLINNMMIRRQRGYRRGGATGPVDGDTYGVGDHVKKKFRPGFL